MNPVYLRRCRSCDVGDDDDVCVPQAADQESREHLIKTHYMSRVSDLTSQLQMCDSKAVHFHAEVSTQTRCSDRIHTSTVWRSSKHELMHSCSSIVSDPWGCLKLMCVFCAIGVSPNTLSVCRSSSNWCSVGAEKQSTDEWINYSLYTVKYLHEKYTSALNSGLISVQLHSCSLMKVKHGPLR